MKEAAREIIYVVVLVGLSMLVSKVVWLLPLIIFLPIVLTYSVNGPSVYLAVLAVYTELFSVSLPGLASLVVFLPYLVKKVWRGQVDVSAALVGILSLTIIMQTVTLFLPEIISMRNVAVIPWTVVGPMMLITIITSFLTIIWKSHYEMPQI